MAQGQHHRRAAARDRPVRWAMAARLSVGWSPSKSARPTGRGRGIAQSRGHAQVGLSLLAIGRVGRCRFGKMRENLSGDTSNVIVPSIDAIRTCVRYGEHECRDLNHPRSARRCCTAGASRPMGCADRVGGQGAYLP
jgi:hypothetical protein